MSLKTVTCFKRNTECYAVITRSGYGRIDDTSTRNGMCAIGVFSGVVIIAHCARLKRTVLINTTYRMNVKQILQPIFDWVVAKNEEQNNSQWNPIDVAVLRGYLHWQINHTLALLSYDGFMQNVTDFLNEAYKEHATHIDGTRILLESSHGQVFVDKGTGLITIPISPMKMMPSQGYSKQQMAREIFSNDFMPLLFENGNTVKERHLQFDINYLRPHSKIDDNCRLLLRGNCAFGCSFQQMVRLAAAFKIAENLPAFLEETFDMMRSLDQPCEICFSEGKINCFKCKGAWYCSLDHQQEDFNEHQRFCRKYELPENLQS